MYISKRLKELRTVSGFSKKNLRSSSMFQGKQFQVGKMKGAILMFTI